MRNYQPKKNNPCKLPHNLYMQMLYLVRDYDRLKAERADILHSTPIHDGTGHTSGISSPTEVKAVRLSEINAVCDKIQASFDEVPEEYRQAILNNICYGSPYPYTAHRNTYSYWRAKLLYSLAKKMKRL